MAILDDMRSLDHGDLPSRLEPAAKQFRRGTKYHLLKEQWRAVQWVSYLTGQTGKESAVNDVADHYGVSEKTIYNWHEATELISFGHRRDRDLDDARKAGESRQKPNFTRSPYRFQDNQPYRVWLKHDADYYKNLVNPMT